LPYSVELHGSAERTLARLSKPMRRRVARAIDALAEDPHPADPKKKLRGQGHPPANEVLYRIRVGQFRIIYTVDDDVLRVLVVQIGSRGDICKHLALVT
jgi:mRNA interferase RelE/StbE